MGTELTAAPADSATRLAGHLLARLPALTAETVRRIRDSMSVYRSAGPLPAGDLTESVRSNIEFTLRRLGHEEELCLEAPRRTGRLRAEQGVPLATVQSAFRIGFAHLWETMAAESLRHGLASSEDLVQMATYVWRFNEESTTAMMNAFNETAALLMVRRDQERSALVDVVLRGGMGNPGSVLEAADMLTLPYDGTFAVVVAHAPGLARQALPDIEPTLREHDMGSAWRLTPDAHIGIVSMRAAAAIDQLVDTLRQQTVRRAGVSPCYTRLDQTPQALHLAQVALASSARPDETVTLFDDNPLPMLVASAPSTASRIGNQVLGPVMELPDSQREQLLSTMATWFAVDGSADKAAKLLYCHPNTIRYRLRRIEQLSGRSFERRLDSAELYIALQAVLHLPGVVRDPLE
ncbi:CdaR family transcriptional regulator [Streptomyces sp. TLI_171]|uniref:PucR family transcriptional regulator n=1 Tax=Streptomyces sp. TLI_171 TaxID=1938859 RepID=UPI000C17F48B|nr:helix-turn-helix domain-containing protein [Streptomyces sp. TLI_171]RKE17893.1 PucR-like helix-turn-helix protein [Streptomyces sp. TLI_171]